MDDQPPFWKTTPLAEMDGAQWESLCDGCGRCCLNKLEWIEDGTLEYTKVACRLLDLGSCKCGDYNNRFSIVDDCVAITPDNLDDLNWLPPTCGYRLIAEGKDLYWWHPLLSGDPNTVHEAGISVRGRCVSETHVPDDQLQKYIVSWPGELVEVEKPRNHKTKS